MTKEFILVLGPQGSGKSTQAKQLAEFLGYTFISTGDLLRKLKESKDPVGDELAQYWVTGQLVPDKLIEKKVLFPKLEETETSGFVLDGYPRNVAQLASFVKYLESKEWQLTNVFYLEVGNEECMKRLTLRVELEKREDETEEAIQNRLDIFFAQTKPLLKEYRKMGILHNLDGERSIEDIQSDIREIMKPA